jgi:hypothetical protein
MTLNGSSNDPRVAALKAEWTQRRTRFFLTFAVLEGVVIALAVVAVFVLRLVDEDLGLMIIVGIAVLGGLVMSFTLLSQQRAYQQQLRDITGF